MPRKPAASLRTSDLPCAVCSGSWKASGRHDVPPGGATGSIKINPLEGLRTYSSDKSFCISLRVTRAKQEGSERVRTKGPPSPKPSYGFFQPDGSMRPKRCSEIGCKMLDCHHLLSFVCISFCIQTNLHIYIHIHPRYPYCLYIYIYILHTYIHTYIHIIYTCLPRTVTAVASEVPNSYGSWLVDAVARIARLSSGAET